MKNDDLNLSGNAVQPEQTAPQGKTNRRDFVVKLGRALLGTGVLIGAAATTQSALATDCNASCQSACQTACQTGCQVSCQGCQTSQGGGG
jgi:hypothetical protein